MAQIIKDENGNTMRDPRKCKYCGEYYDYSHKYGGVEEGSCSDCQFWRDIIARDKGENKMTCVVVKGNHYYIGSEPDKDKPHHVLGYGGSEFIIKFKDGRYIVSHNVWCQGKIPTNWIPQLPDNAVFKS